jgi:DNA repair protein RecO (recombination protein O)
MGIVNTQVAYILHKRSYRETSSILEVLTKDYGRVSLIARASRGSRSKTAGSLLQFTPLVISWQGKGSLPNLKSAERAELKAPTLKKKSLLAAMYINELLIYLLHKHDVHEDVFEHYHHTLYKLQDEASMEIVLRQFELKLLELLGFGLSLDREADTGRPIRDDATYEYHLEHGPVVCNDVSAMNSSRAPKVSGRCLLAISADEYDLIARDSVQLAELKQLMRFIIAHHLGGKKLKSRELFRPVANRN